MKEDKLKKNSFYNFKFFKKENVIPNLHNKKTFWGLFLLLVVVLTFIRNYAYYNTKEMTDSIEITNLAKNIHLNLEKCLYYKKNKDECILELKDDLLDNLKPHGIVKVYDSDRLLIDYDHTKPRHIDRKIVTLSKYLIPIKNYNYNLYIAKHSIPNISLTVFRSVTFSLVDVITHIKQTNLKDTIDWYKSNRIYLRSKGTLFFILIVFVVLFFIKKWQQTEKKDFMHNQKHNPRALVKLLSNFTRDTPLKFTTHIWDKSIIKEHDGYSGFINDLKDQWGKIETELNTLSPKLHKKIHNFIFASKGENTWVIKDNIAIGWSSLDGFEQWCNAGNDPFDFKLKTAFIVDGKEIAKFGDIVNIFKQEIEIRKEYHMLENIFMDLEENLDSKFSLETVKLNGKNFYTDVETFKNTLNKIFAEIQKREFFEINIEALDTTGEYIELKIIQKGSRAQMSAKNMLEAAGDGDFGDIKEWLTNLCDWSIESSFEDKNYRVNYLRSDQNIAEIELLDYIPKGFTHILRFYKK